MIIAARSFCDRRHYHHHMYRAEGSGNGSTNEWKIFRRSAMKKPCVMRSVFAVYSHSDGPRIRLHCHSGYQLWTSAQAAVKRQIWHYSTFFIHTSATVYIRTATSTRGSRAGMLDLLDRSWSTFRNPPTRARGSDIVLDAESIKRQILLIVVTGLPPGHRFTAFLVKRQQLYAKTPQRRLREAVTRETFHLFTASAVSTNNSLRIIIRTTGVGR